MIAQGMPHIDNKRQLRLENFSCFVAILPWFNIDVLHKLYLNIFEKFEPEQDTYTYKLRAITCADLLQSPEVERIGYNSFIINPSVQETLRNKMTEKDNANEILKEIGNFMLSYTWECKQHFPSLKHLESYRIEGNIILNPIAEAERVTHNIINRFNRLKNQNDRKNAVGYYLQVLNHNNLSAEQEKLVEFLNVYQHLDQDINQNNAAQFEKLRTLLSAETNSSESITIKLPTDIKKKILEGIKATTSKTPTLHALIIGINQYRDYENQSLQSAIKDAQAIGEYLQQHEAEGHLCEIHLLINEQAKYTSVQDYLNKYLFKQMNAGDSFFLYFAGHGGYVNSNDLQSSSNSRNSSNNDFDPLLDLALTLQENLLKCVILNDSSTLSLLDVLGYVDRFPHDCTYTIILDTDFNYHLDSTKINIAQGDGELRMTADDLTSLQNVIITTSRANQSAVDNTEHGFFTRFLFQVLELSEKNISNQHLVNAINIYLEAINSRQHISLTSFGKSSANNDFLNGFIASPFDKCIKLIQNNKEKKDTTLHLNGKGLTFLPEVIFELNHLKILDISDNSIQHLPEKIGSLINLEELNLSGNPIDPIHSNIDKLSNLKILKLKNCNLTYFPKMVLGLPNLQELDLADNAIRFIPNQLRNLPNLKKLDLTGNAVLNFDIPDAGNDLMAYLIEFPEVDNSNNNIPVVMLVGLDYENKLPNILPEIEEISRICQQSGLEVIQLTNPTAAELNKSINSYQNRLAILHFACYEMDVLTDSDKKPQKLNPEDWIEFFKCIKSERFDTPLLFLNCCYGEEIINPLLKDTFKLGIGLKDQIEDWTAYTFAKQFYTALATEKKTIEEAMSYAQ